MCEATAVHTEARQRAAGRATTRRRAPKQDAVLAQAVETARQAVVDSAGRGNVGEHLGVDTHEDRLLTHLFECTMAGYPGWTWFATVARAPRTKHVTVCEVGLLAGKDSLLAPDWVPWEERVQQMADQDTEDSAREQKSEPEDDRKREEPGAQPEAAETASPEHNSAASDRDGAEGPAQEHENPRADQTSS